MRKEREILKDISHPALGHGQINAGLRVEEYALAHGNGPGGRSGQARHRVEQCRLAGPRSSEQDAEAGGSVEVDVQGKRRIKAGGGADARDEPGSQDCTWGWGQLHQRLGRGCTSGRWLSVSQFGTYWALPQRADGLQLFLSCADLGGDHTRK